MKLLFNKIHFVCLFNLHIIISYTYNNLPPPNNCNISVGVDVVNSLLLSINNVVNSPYNITLNGNPMAAIDVNIIPNRIK